MFKTLGIDGLHGQTVQLSAVVGIGSARKHGECQQDSKAGITEQPDIALLRDAFKYMSHKHHIHNNLRCVIIPRSVRISAGR